MNGQVHTLDLEHLQAAQDTMREYRELCRGDVVYVARDASGLVLYVGVSSHLHNRLRIHKAGADWWPSAVTLDIRPHPDRVTAEADEAALIAEHRPPYNVAPDHGRLPR